MMMPEKAFLDVPFDLMLMPHYGISGLNHCIVLLWLHKSSSIEIGWYSVIQLGISGMAAGITLSYISKRHFSRIAAGVTLSYKPKCHRHGVPHTQKIYPVKNAIGNGVLH